MCQTRQLVKSCLELALGVCVMCTPQQKVFFRTSSFCWMAAAISLTGKPFFLNELTGFMQPKIILACTFSLSELAFKSQHCPSLQLLCLPAYIAASQWESPISLFKEFLLNTFAHNIKFFISATIFSTSFSSCYCCLCRKIKLLAYIPHLAEIKVSGKGCILFPISISIFI